jgi:hypothetical protein
MTMKMNLKAALVLGALLCLSQHAVAEDIDIYAGVGTDVTKPNVLFVFDNAANFSASVTGLP